MTLTTGYLNRATVDHWHDGDTVVLVVDLWPGETMKLSCRLDGLDTPELGRPGSLEAKAFDEKLAPAGSVIMLQCTEHPEDKYGRLLAQLTTADGTSINGSLLLQGLAKPYDGGKKPVWP